MTPTHWKQTVFYLRSKVNVKKGESVEGCIRVVRPKNDPRALDITITIGENTQDFVME